MASASVNNTVEVRGQVQMKENTIRSFQRYYHRAMVSSVAAEIVLGKERAHTKPVISKDELYAIKYYEKHSELPQKKCFGSLSEWFVK